MSEYEKNFNWEKTWLGAPPLRREQQKNANQAEPHFQHRRRVGPADTFTLRAHFSQPQDDEYVLLGRRDLKFGRSVAYPLAKRHVKGCGGQPSREECPAEKVSKTTVTHKTKPPAQALNNAPSNLEDANKSKPPVKHTPRKSLIGAVDSLPHKVHRSHTRSHSQHKKRPVEKWPEIRLDLPPDSTERPMTTGPKAPRAEQKHRDQSMKEEATQVQTTPPIEQQQQQHQYAPLLISRPRTAPQPPAQTEYQRAYSPPPNYAYTRPAHPCLPHADNLGQQSRITRQTPTKQYSTELRKPVSTSYQPRRAHSASLLDKHRPHRDQACSPRQSPHRSCSTYYTQPYHADRYLSEYQAKFRNFSDLPLSSEQTINAYSLALDERLSAARRRGVTEDSHFSRDHLGQLKSNALWLWDSRGSARNTDFSQGTRDAGQMLQNYQLPPAGMPSSPNETSALKATIAPRVPAATREVFPLRPFTQQTATRFGSPKAEIGRSRRPLSQKLQNRKAGIYTTSVSPVRNINSARRFSSPLAEVERHGKIWGSRTSESPLRNITISSARALPTCCLRRRHRVLKSRLRPWNPTQISTLNSSEQKTSCVGLFGMDLPRCRSPASEFATITSLAPKAYDATKYSDWEDSSLNSWRSFSDQKASIGLAVRTLERARQRRNQVLISSCRSPQFEKYWSSTHAETEPQRLCLT